MSNESGTCPTCGFGVDTAPHEYGCKDGVQQELVAPSVWVIERSYDGYPWQVRIGLGYFDTEESALTQIRDLFDLEYARYLRDIESRQTTAREEYEDRLKDYEVLVAAGRIAKRPVAPHFPETLAREEWENSFVRYRATEIKKAQ